MRYRVRWKSFFVFLCCLLCLSACQKSLEQQIAEQLELAQKYLVELKYEEAAIAFQKVIELDPKQLPAYQGLGEVYLAQAEQKENEGQLEEAEAFYGQAMQMFEKILELDPENSKASERLTVLSSDEIKKKEDDSSFSSNGELLILSKEKQYQMNTFLSDFSDHNFSETYIWDEEENDLVFAPEKFEVKTGNVMEMIKFAWRYAKLNMNKTVDVKYDDFYYYGIGIDTINDNTQRFFGQSVDIEDVSTESINEFGYYNHIVIDGKLCYPAADGDTYDHISIAKNVYDLDNGNLQVEFNIYSINDEDIVPPTFTIQDKSLYYFTDEKAKQHPAFEYYLCGIAVIEPYISSDKKESYRLVSYELMDEEREKANLDEVLNESSEYDLQTIWENYMQSVGKESAYFLPADFDGDGNQEAFGITGDFDGDMVYSDVKIYYISSEGNIGCMRETTQDGTSLYGYLVAQTEDPEDTENAFFMSASDSKFIIWEVNAYGSGSRSIILGVKNGVAYEPDISEQYSNFKKSNTGEFVGFTSDYSKGSLDFVENLFIFDEGQFFLIN